MTNAKHGANKYAKAKAFVHERWGWLINQTISRAHKPRPQKKPEEPADKAARRTALATILIAVFTVVLAGVGYLQYRETRDSGLESSEQMNQMLREYRAQVAQIKRQAGDTHDLAVAAGKQADASNKIAANASIQSKATRDLVSNAQGQLDTIRRQLENSERPWVSITSDVASPLQFDANGAGLTLKFSIFNGGQAPATNVFPFAEFYLPYSQVRNDEKARFCRESVNYSKTEHQRMELFLTVLPQGHEAASLSFSIANKQILAHPHPGNPTFFYPEIIVCTVYDSVFIPAEHYYTVDVYGVRKDAANDPVIVGQSVPLKDLVLIKGSTSFETVHDEEEKINKKAN